MPSLEEVNMMRQKKVYRVLCSQPISIFYEHDPKELKKQLSMNTAYSYISNLILINDKQKSNFKKIKEVHRKLEDDKERESIEAKQKT